MITRFDHFVIAVRDLDAEIQHYRALGFDVQPGGRHVGLGTYNALIRFGLDYIELLSVYDEGEARSSGGLRGEVLLEFLQKWEAGLVGYVLAATDIQQVAEGFRDGPYAGEPFAMSRRRPDGKLLSWRLFVPDNIAWRRPWPYFIQWDMPDEQRLSWDSVGAHSNGAVGWSKIAVVVRDLEGAIDLYTHQIGLKAVSINDVPHLAARRAVFPIGSSSVELLTPVGKGSVQQMLDEAGEGPFEVTLDVKNLEQTRDYLQQQGVDVEPYVDSTLLFSAGVRIVLRERLRTL